MNKSKYTIPLNTLTNPLLKETKNTTIPNRYHKTSPSRLRALMERFYAWFINCNSFNAASLCSGESADQQSINGLYSEGTSIVSPSEKN